MSLDDLSQLQSSMNGIMQSATTMGIVAQTITAYDQFAVKAMAALIARAQWDDNAEDVPTIMAADAWAIADAMMAERKKRGLGAWTPQDAPVTNGAT